MDAGPQILGIILLRCVPMFADLPTIHLREDISRRDLIFLDGNLAEIETKSLLKCANKCIMTDTCVSIFYHSKTNHCVLHQFLGAYLDLQQAITTMFNGWRYYQKVDGFGLSSRGVQCLKSGFLYDLSVDVCYSMKTNVPFNFDVVNEECANMNSDLIKIPSQQKQDWITGVLAENTDGIVCIQGNNDNENAQYQFNDGTPMTYFNWNNGENQPNRGPEHYLIMRKNFNYLWHDASKVYPNYKCLVICEK